MKLWLSGEIDMDINDLHFGKAMNEVEDEINKKISDLVDMDIGVDSWDCIAIIRSDNYFNEIIKYSAKKRDMDLRLIIDHSAFKNGTDEDRKILFKQMLQRSLEILETKVPEKLKNNVRDFMASLNIL